MYTNIESCKRADDKPKNPFVDDNNIVDLNRNIKCVHHVYPSNKNDLKLKLQLFNPLRVISTSSNTFFQHKLPQKLGIHPIIVSTKNILGNNNDASSRNKKLALFNLCCTS